MLTLKQGQLVCGNSAAACPSYSVEPLGPCDQHILLALDDIDGVLFERLVGQEPVATQTSDVHALGSVPATLPPMRRKILPDVYQMARVAIHRNSNSKILEAELETLDGIVRDTIAMKLGNLRWSPQQLSVQCLHIGVCWKWEYTLLLPSFQSILCNLSRYIVILHQELYLCTTLLFSVAKPLTGILVHGKGGSLLHMHRTARIQLIPQLVVPLYE
nr:alpha-amylase C-terminal beta-sheet domain-containing protein [uncultured Duncaniella sp.]